MDTIHDDFYHNLAGCGSFAAALASGCAQPVPDDWIIIGTDVEKSTAAITAGRYKDVTVAGAIGTISIANITGSLDFPFFFGGDGMVFLLPGRYRSDVLDVLADVRQTIREISELSLRAGIVSVGELRRRGHDLRIGRVKITERYSQAIADGSALAAFDTLLKDDTDATVTRPADAPRPGGRRADFRGFSCRWKDIRSSRGETVSLIVLPRSERPGSGGRRDRSDDSNERDSSNRSGSVTERIDTTLTRNVLLQARQIIDRIVGDETAAHPLTVSAQSTTAAPAVAGHEARYMGRRTRGMRVVFQQLRIAMEVAVVRFALWSRLPIRGMGKRLRDVREDNIRNADIQKLDGAMKMVLSLTRQEREAIIAGLDEMRNDGLIWYGWHRSDRAIMTCLIHTNNEDEVHFVDAADGGYTLAARMLKEQIAEDTTLSER